ncbi:MAG: heme exporter protein CcmB [Arenicellales bacterium]
MASSNFKAFKAELKADLTLAYRNKSALFNPLLFFIMVAVLFAFGVGPETTVLSTLAPGVVWVAALLSSLLALDHLFREDYDNGSLEQLVLSPHSSSGLVLAKIIVHWLVTGLPLIIISPFIGLMMQLPSQAFGTMILSLLLGTPALSLIGAVGVGLTAGVKRSGLLLSLLVIPLFIPVLIFGASAVQAATMGLPVSGQLYLLAAFSMMSLMLAPFAASAAIRISLN